MARNLGWRNIGPGQTNYDELYLLYILRDSGENERKNKWKFNSPYNTNQGEIAMH